MSIKISETQWLLINLLINNAIRAIIDKTSEMTEEELQAAIADEEKRKENLMSELDSH